MSTPNKRVLTEAAFALNNPVGPPSASASDIPEDVSLQLQNVGRKVRQSVSSGYRTHLALGVQSLAPQYSQDDSGISSSSAAPYFRSAIDDIQAARFSYAHSNQPGLQRFCDSGEPPVWGPDVAITAHKKRERGSEEADATEAEDEAMELAAPSGRLIKAAPRRAVGRGLSRTTQSLPAGAFKFGGAEVEMATPAEWGSPSPAASNIPTSFRAPNNANNEPDFGDIFSNPEDF